MTEPPEKLSPFTHSASNRCFGCGPANSTGMHLEFFLAPDGSVVSFPVVGSGFDGHPGYLHGGIIATLLDEAMSKAVRVRGTPSMTARLRSNICGPFPAA